MMEQEQIAYSVSEASKVLGTTESAVRAMVQRRQIPVTHIGRRVFILHDDIQRLLREQLFA